jgi:hypothetical protein
MYWNSFGLFQFDSYYMGNTTTIKKINSVIIMELHNSWKWVFLHNYNWIAMSCTIYMVSYNYVTHSTCLLAFTVYKYNGLQCSMQLKNWVYIYDKLSCKASCKISFFS